MLLITCRLVSAGGPAAVRSLCRFALFSLLGGAIALSQNAHALSMELETLVGSDAGFSFPRIHNATHMPVDVLTDAGPATFYKDGVGPTLTVLETVTADVTTTGIAFSGGRFQLGDGSVLPDFVITGGEISFLGLGPDVFAGTLETTEYGTFHILNRIWVPEASLYPPNTFFPGDEDADADGFLALWANNWATGDGPSEGGAWGIDLVFRFDPASDPPVDPDPDPEPPVVIPEPSTALLLGLGFLALAAGRRNP